MPGLIVFNSVTLDGYFTGKNGDMSWAHRQSDPEWDEFVEGNASGGGVLVFGRVTYEMMKSFWPTPAAFKIIFGVLVWGGLFLRDGRLRALIPVRTNV